MKNFFDDAEAVQRLRKAANEWFNTPFREFSRAKGEGGGVDCVGLAEELMIEAGVAKRGEFSFARSKADYQGHRVEERVPNELRGSDLRKLFAEIELPEHDTGPYLGMPGDLVVMRSHGLFHLPIMLGEREFIHAIPRAGVIPGHINDTTFSKHLIAIFRPLRVKIGDADHAANRVATEGSFTR